jgi:SnoaL-like domain
VKGRTLSARDAVLFANEAFYRAFSDRDFAQMESIWGEDPVSCIHPGSTALIGRSAVLESWKTILVEPYASEIGFHRPEAFVLGDVAYVVCYEDVRGAIFVTTNIFRRRGSRWMLIHHHPGLSPDGPTGSDEKSRALPN